MIVQAAQHPSPMRRVIAAALGAPVLLIFLSSNFVNVGNLAFNMIFSRWMGPELFGDLATLLTLKLALLGVLGAVQIAVSQKIANADPSRRVSIEIALGRLNTIAFISLWLLMPVICTLIWAGGVDEWLGLGEPNLVLILCASLPFVAPLSIMRGIAIGRLDAGQVVISANAEMLVRLVGAVLAWQAGFGIEGVVTAIAVSIIAGWIVLAGRVPVATSDTQKIRIAKVIGVAAIPFAALQAAQVVILDGDVILAKIALGGSEAGYVAALSLFQRIQFFGCFGLASVLLPAVAMAASNGGSTLKAALPVGALFLAVSAVVLIGGAMFPGQLITAMVGSAFADAAPALPLAVLSAIAFTASYLIATFLAAIGDRTGIWCIAAAAPTQVVVILTALTLAGSDLSVLLGAKLFCQILLVAALVVLAVRRITSAGGAA